MDDIEDIVIEQLKDNVARFELETVEESIVLTSMEILSKTKMAFERARKTMHIVNGEMVEKDEPDKLSSLKSRYSSN
jgi:hypothetical protein